MIIDCHMHYEPDIMTLERTIAGMDDHGIDKTALIATMVEPFSIQSKARQATGDVMRATLFRANKLGQLLYQSTLSSKGYFVVLGKKYRIYDNPDNVQVADAISRYPDRFMGWIFINPTTGGDTVAEIEKWSSNPGMIGVKAHPFWHRYPVEKLDPAAAWCRDNRYPLLIHLGARGGSGDYRRLPDKFPGLKLVYAHAGIPYFQELWSYIKDKDGVYVDLSSPYLNSALVAKTVDFLGPAKCLYGTDGPYGAQPLGKDYDYGLIKGWVENATLRGGHDQVFFENFQSIIRPS